MDDGSSLFWVSLIYAADRTTVAVGGELDVYFHRPLHTALDEAITGGGAHRIELDLRDLSFSDIRGLAILVRAREKAVQAGCGFEIVGPIQPRVLRALQMYAPVMGLPVRPRVDRSSPPDADPPRIP
ncbi:STAS domain-containing protein [Streptomyces sp. HUAS TT3]|uniref:STAS domain-containing protein n=1 Tax=Streptomyces sp. HUAS TT3 TaxID=3447510 RepID=UPI003F656E53